MASMLPSEQSVSHQSDSLVSTPNKVATVNQTSDVNKTPSKVDNSMNCGNLLGKNNYDSTNDAHFEDVPTLSQGHSFLPLSSKDLPSVDVTSSMIQSNFDNLAMSKEAHEVTSNGVNGYYMDHHSMTTAPQVFTVPPSYFPMNLEHAEYDKMFIGPLASYPHITQPLGNNGSNFPRGDIIVTPTSSYPQPVSVLSMEPPNFASSTHRYPSNPVHQFSTSSNIMFSSAGPVINSVPYGNGGSVISMLPSNRTDFPISPALMPNIGCINTIHPSGHSYHNLNIDSSSASEHVENGNNSKASAVTEEKQSQTFPSSNSTKETLDDANHCIQLSNGDTNDKSHNANSDPNSKENDTAIRDVTDASGNNGGEYYVMVHVNGGETFSVKVGGQLQHIQGPATVRMVSKKGPPMLMPMQVPPGHLVQQIVDENGILTHIILSPYPPPQLHSGPLPPLLLSPGMPSSHPPHIMTCGAPLSSDMASGHLYVPASVPPPPSSGADDRSEYNSRLQASPLPNSTRPGKRSTASYYDEGQSAAAMRRRKSRNKTVITANNNTNANYNSNYEYRNTSSSGGEDGTTTHGKADAHDEEDGNASFGNQNPQSSFKSTVRRILNATPSPEVSDVEARSASIQLYAPDMPDQMTVEINEADITYDLYLSENGPEGYYKCIFRGEAMEICLRDLKPDTEYYVKASTSLANIHGARSSATRFKTQACEPNAPKPPSLGQKTRNTLALKWSNAVENGSKLTSFLLEWKHATDPKSEWAELYSGLQRYFKATKLTSSTMYTFRLAALNAYGQGPWSEEVSYSTAGLAPEKPEAPQLMRQEVHGLGLSWNKRSSDEKFVMEMEDEATCHGFIPVFLGDQLSHFFDNLRRNTRYRFRLAAENVEGRSQWSEVVTYNTLPDVPSPPKKMEIKGKVSTSKFHLCWNEPEDDGGSPVNEYRVQISQCAASSPLARRMDVSVGADVDLLWTQVYQGSSRECHLNQLTPGSVIWVRVSCHSTGGWGPWSPIPLRVRLIPAAPGPVTGLRLAPGKNPVGSQLHLLWNKPEKDGGAESLTYEIQQVDQLTPPESPVKSVGAESAPEKKTTSSTSSVSEEPAKVNVKEPKNRSNSGALPENIVYDGHLTECHVTNLIAGHEYLFRVRAKNEAGVAGPWSEPALQLFCGPCQPVAPDAPLPVCSSTPAMSIQVTWTPPAKCYGSPVTEYRLEMRQQTSHKYMQVYIGKELHYHLRQYLEPATGYVFRVQAINSAGASPFSPESEVCVTGSSTPGLISQLNISSELSEEDQDRILAVMENDDKDSGTMQLFQEMYSRADLLWVTWKEPACHGSPITGYTVEWCVDATLHQALTDAGSTTTAAPTAGANVNDNFTSAQPTRTTSSANVDAKHCFYVITELKPNTQYKVRVQAHNEVGSGPYTNFNRSRTKSLPPGPPTLECMQSQSNSLKLKWTPPCQLGIPSSTGVASTSSSAPDGGTVYQLDMSRAASSGWHNVYSGSLLSHKVIKLTEYTNYYFRIRASNKFGVGPWSSVSRFSTSKAAPPALRSPRVNDISTTSALVEWNPIKPLGQDVILYALQLLAVSGNDLEYRQVYRGSETSFRLQGLTTGTEYLVRVCAIRLSSNIRSRQTRKRRRVAPKMEPGSTSADEERETNTESDVNEEDVDYEEMEEDEENAEKAAERPEKEVMCEIMGTFSQATSFVTRKILQLGPGEHATKKKSMSSAFVNSSTSAAVSQQKPDASTWLRMMPHSLPNLAQFMRRPRLTDNEVALLLLAVFVLLVALVVYLVQSCLL